MINRVNWNDDELEKIWNYRYGNNNLGCYYPNTTMRKSNYGNHSDTVIQKNQIIFIKLLWFLKLIHNWFFIYVFHLNRKLNLYKNIKKGDIKDE